MTPATPLSDRFAGVSWAFFFVWIGVALLSDLGWGWTLSGVGVLILATQAALFLRAGKVHGVWVTCGIVVLASSAWILLGVQWPLGPALLVVVGVVMLASTFFGARRRQ